MDPIQPIPATPSGGYLASQPQTPVTPVSGIEQREENYRQQQAVTFGEKAQASWNQDYVFPGVVAEWETSKITPDPDYTPFNPDEWKRLSEGVWPEFAHELGRASSQAQADNIRQRLLQKQSEVTTLSGLGVPGQALRMGAQLVHPENLMLGGFGGLIREGYQGAKLARSIAGAKGAVEEALIVKSAQAAAAASKAGTAPIAFDLAVSGAGNAAQEKLRQSVNFEDDSAMVTEAALIGAAFPVPFHLAGAKQANRVAAAAAEELSALRILKKGADGEQLSRNEANVLERVVAKQEVLKAVEEGHIAPHEALDKLNSLSDLTVSDKAWLDGTYTTHLTERANAAMDAVIPARVLRRTREQLGVTDTPLLGHDPKVTNWTADSTIAVGSNGLAVPPGQVALSAADLIKLQIANEKKLPKEKRRAAALLRAEESRKATMGEAKQAADPSIGPKKPDEVLLGKEAPTATPEAPKVEAGATPAVEAPSAPKGPVQGETVTWSNKRTGEQQWGQFESVRADGWYMVRNEDGDLVPLPPTALLDAPPPEGFVPESGLRSGGSAVVLGEDGMPISAFMDKDVSAQLSRMNKEGLRWDYFGVLNRSESSLVRKAVYMLVKDPLQNDNQIAQGFTASEYKSYLRRTVAGPLHREFVEAVREAMQAAKVSPFKAAEFHHEFYSLVTQLTRGDFTVKDLRPELAPMLTRASNAQKAFYERMLKSMKEHGVLGAEELAAHEFYVNRVWNQRSIRAAIDKHGEANVLRLLADAINVPGFNGDVAKAGAFLHAVQKLEFSQSMQTMHLGTKDMGTLRNELGRYLEPHEVDLIVDTMFEAKAIDGSDAGRAPNLKYRFDIGEHLSTKTEAGILKVSDLFENDARVLADGYMNSMGGRIGLAKNGIFSDADWQRVLKDITEDAIASGHKNVVKDVQKLNDIHAHITGRPMSTADFSETARVASSLRAVTRSLTLGQLGLTAAFEMKQAIGLMGFRAFWQQLPAFRGAIQALRDGHIPNNELANQILNMSGFGFEKSMSYARAQEIDDGFLGQSLTRFEGFANKASHAVDIMSGNASFTSLTRQLSSMMAMQHMSDFAHGRAELTPKLRERLVGWGLSQEDMDKVFTQLKRYSEVNPSTGKLEAIKWEQWAEEANATYETMQLVNSRLVRDAIQDQDLGETMPFMHTTLGKTMFELKTFFLVGHAKNMLKNVSYMDKTALHLWGVSFIGEALAYSTQVSLNYALDPEKRAEMLTPEKIASAVMARNSVTGLLPFFANTGYQIATGGESLVGPDMTTSGNGRSFVPPSMRTMQRAFALPSTVTGLLLDNGTVTRQEGKEALMIPNLIGTQAVGNWITNSLPAKEATP